MNITIPINKKEILVDYMISFAQASLVRYNTINFLNLHFFNCPLGFKEVLDFEFANQDIQSLFEFYFMDNEGLMLFNEFIKDKEIDLSIEYMNKHMLFHFFCINETILLTSKLSNEERYNNLWMLYPCNVDGNILIEMEEDMYLFFEEIKQFFK